MVELSDTQYDKIDKTMDSVIEIKAILLGSNGDRGLVGKVNDICEDHYTLKRNFWAMVGVLIGSGLLGGGLWALLS